MKKIMLIFALVAMVLSVKAQKQNEVKSGRSYTVEEFRHGFLDVIEKQEVIINGRTYVLTERHTMTNQEQINVLKAAKAIIAVALWGSINNSCTGAAVALESRPGEESEHGFTFLPADGGRVPVFSGPEVEFCTNAELCQKLWKLKGIDSQKQITFYFGPNKLDYGMIYTYNQDGHAFALIYAK